MTSKAAEVTVGVPDGGTSSFSVGDVESDGVDALAVLRPEILEL
jgi:hypothetical protein